MPCEGNWVVSPMYWRNIVTYIVSIIAKMGFSTSCNSTKYIHTYIIFHFFTSFKIYFYFYFLDRYRLQSDQFEAMWLILDQFLKRMKVHFDQTDEVILCKTPLLKDVSLTFRYAHILLCFFFLLLFIRKFSDYIFDHFSADFIWYRESKGKLWFFFWGERSWKR